MNKLLRNTHNGFSVVELVIIVAIIGVIGGAGYLVYSRQSNDTAKETENTQVADDTVPAINSAEDLDTASQALDDTDLDAADAELDELESNLSEI